MSAAFIGLDLAKSVFQVHGVDAQGKVVVTKRLRRDAVLAFFANLTPCVVGMEACAGSHFWAREIARLGHTVWLMAPQYVKPYVKRHKNDRADAEAICEAVQRPSMRFVAVKGGPGEWLVEKHGTSRRHSWRKLHIGFDAVTGRIVASIMTDRDVDDASQVEPCSTGSPSQWSFSWVTAALTEPACTLSWASAIQMQ